MSNRAAIVTGGSRGIGRAIAEALGQDGYGVTITARKPETLEAAAAELRERGFSIEAVAANLAHGDSVAAVVEAHRARFGRLDVLVNNAGIGVGAAADGHEPKLIDLQTNLNLVAPILFYKHSLELLRAAAAEHRTATVINLASMAGVVSAPWLSVYGATKAALMSYTRSMNKELASQGIKSVALAPAFVDTDMSDFMKDEIPPDQMIPVSDVVAAVRFVLGLSPNCLVPEIILGRPSETGF